MNQDLMAFVQEWFTKLAYVINLDEHMGIGTHWVTLYVKNKTSIYFDSFGIEHISKEIIKFIKNKNIKTNIFRLQACESIMCGYFCNKYIDYMFKGKSLVDYTNLFSPKEFKKNHKIIKRLFK